MTLDPVPNNLLRTSEAVSYLQAKHRIRADPGTVRRWADRRLLPHSRKVVGRWWHDPADLDRMVVDMATVATILES